MNARAVAIDVLARVEATDAYLNVVLDQRLAEAPLRDPRDAGLVTELCYGATRRRLALDRVIAGFSDRKLPALEDRVLAALRVGSYQIFFSRVPRRAAVSETVEGLKQLGLSRASGFVNAVLRKVASVESIPLPPESDLAEHLSVRESHP
ncbi:MAG TPA: transcription antitermination factor NusB, partial [Myxococcaceae bacterium]|nr:transcription antitermination factor NusB [Myxococcaceae bacterium]